MGVATLISVEEYLDTSFSPDRDFINGEVRERNGGERTHSYAQARIASWFIRRSDKLRLDGLKELRMRMAKGRIRIPDVVVSEIPIPDEEVFTTPPYLCIEILSPDDTLSDIQERTDEYLAFGVPNVWVVDPWKHRGWLVTPGGWDPVADGIMRTPDGRVAMPLVDVLLP